MWLAWILVSVLVQSVFAQEDEIIWDNYMANFKLNEGLPIGTYVDTLKAHNKISGTSENIIYGFNNQQGNEDLTFEHISSIFEIEQGTGNVTIYGTVLDYENQQVAKEFNQNFIAMNNITKKFNRIKSKITLTNLNDNSASFSDTANIFVNESTVIPPEGILLFKDFTAFDPDLLTYNQEKLITMEIESCQYYPNTNGSDDCKNRFFLKPISQSNQEYVVDIYLNKSLDYETYEVINIIMKASDGQLSSKKDLVVTVNNEQDQVPIWTLLPQTAQTDENNPDFNVKVVAEDGDGLGRRVYYSLGSGTGSKGVDSTVVFQIDPFTGIITNKTELDMEDTKVFRNYALRIERTDWEVTLQACEIENENPLVLTDSCAIVEVIRITVNDVNDNAPEHKYDLYEFGLEENEPNGKSLEETKSGYSIDIFDRDTDKFNQYFTEFIDPSNEFVIDRNVSNPTIRIKNTKLIDMDKGPRVYTLMLRSFDRVNNALSSTATVKIYIEDRNDLRPYFPNDSYTGQVSENAQQGDLVATVQAYDDDYDVDKHGNRSIVYTLLGYEYLFEIDKFTGAVKVKSCDTDSNGRHGVHPCIDYDINEKEYNLLVKAADNKGGSNANFDTVNLFIQVVKVNDNPPTAPDYNLTIIENRKTFVPSLFIQGRDSDDVDGVSSLSYSMFSQNPNTNLWQVNRTTGEVSVNKPGPDGINYKEGNIGGKFFLEIEVTDGLYTVTSRVNITVIDRNDNPPIFQSFNYTFSISELTPGDTSIYQIKAIDQDDSTTPNGQLQYTIFSGNSEANFALVQANGDIYTTVGATFDYDRTNVYHMTALVVDGGTPQLQGFANITIYIIDKNNKNPEVTPLVQPFSVSENAFPNTIVGEVKARDLDANANLMFEFIEPMKAFTKDGQNLLRSNYDFTILFFIERDTGVIRVNQTKLNYDLTRDLSFGIKVTDTAPNPPQEGVGTVTIEVIPYDETPPVFEAFDTPISLPEELPPRSIVISLIASDKNGIKEYMMFEQPNNFFQVSPNTGSVSIKNTVDYDDARMINDSYFIVQAWDNGTPQSLSATASVSVIFYNINDEYPYFVDPFNVMNLQDIYFGTIKENSPDGTPVTLVMARDNDRPDSKGFHLVRYFMNDDRFQVDTESGEVTVRLRGGFELDRESNPRVVAYVLARDNPAASDVRDQNQAEATIQITLEDVNDNPPIFSERDYTTTVFELISLQTDIIPVFIYDLDIGINAISVFRKMPDPGNLENFDYDNLFGVRNESGNVYVAKSLEGYSRRAPYVFYIQAQDERGKGFNTSVKVSVYVQEAANSPPRIMRPPRANMTIYVLESQYNGMLVYDVKAVDGDTGTNGIVDYSVIYEGVTTQTTPEFEINRVNGMIHAQIVYDREKVDRYVLLLKASDRGQTPLESTRFLTIVVKDVNDNAPIFPADEYTGEILTIEFRVPENFPRNELIGQVQATDADLNPIIIYEFIGGNEDGVFALDPNTGVLTLAKTLDSEVKSVYYLDIKARNEEPEYTVIRSRRRRAIDPSIITVKVLVGNINDEAPVYLQDEYYGCVSTRSPFGKHIMTVQARDDDAAGSGIVRYSIMNGNKDGGQILFDIHEKYGVITNKALMRDYVDKTFQLTVNARDGEDPANSESANITVLTFVTMPGREVKMTITQNTQEVRLYQTQIQSIIEEAADLDYLCINEIEDHVTEGRGASPTLWSDVYVSGVRRLGNGQFQIVSGVELRNIISREISNRKKDFDLLYIRDVELASSSDKIRLEDKAVLIILIIIAVLIFLVIIFCIVAFMCIRAAKQQKKQILVHKTHATPAPIMVVQPEPEPVVYDNRQYVQEVQVRDPQPQLEPEPVVVSTFQDERVYEPEPVHVQYEYAVVQKRTPSPQYEDDQEPIVVELKEDPPAGIDVYEPEYRIEAEVEDK